MRDGDDWTELMRAAAAGDEAAYARLLRSLAGPLRAFVRNGLSRSRLGDGDAEDVVQEVLLTIHLKRHTWDPAEPARPWIYAIARHKLIDALRRRGRRAEVDIDDFADSLAEPAPAETIPDRDLQRGLEALTANQRAVVTAVSLEGLSAREAGERLGLREGTVRVTLHRALGALAARFARGSET